MLDAVVLIQMGQHPFVTAVFAADALTLAAYLHSQTAEGIERLGAMVWVAKWLVCAALLLAPSPHVVEWLHQTPSGVTRIAFGWSLGACHAAQGLSLLVELALLALMKVAVLRVVTVSGGAGGHGVWGSHAVWGVWGGFVLGRSISHVYSLWRQWLQELERMRAARERRQAEMELLEYELELLESTSYLTAAAVAPWHPHTGQTPGSPPAASTSGSSASTSGSSADSDEPSESYAWALPQHYATIPLPLAAVPVAAGLTTRPPATIHLNSSATSSTVSS